MCVSVCASKRFVHALPVFFTFFPVCMHVFLCLQHPRVLRDNLAASQTLENAVSMDILKTFVKRSTGIQII